MTDWPNIARSKNHVADLGLLIHNCKFSLLSTMEKLSKKALALSGSTEATLRFISYRRPVSILSIACLSIGIVCDLTDRFILTLTPALISLLNKFGLDRVISRNAYWTSSCFIFLRKFWLQYI